jgi:glyoxylase-like metal-dependent hydrolase (beta-lactamase superfamily II)
MTGPGTNSYLIGHDAVTVLDPGPAIDAHVDGDSRRGRRAHRASSVTHTHPDHSPAWQALAEATGATVIGALPGATITRTSPSPRTSSSSTAIAAGRGWILSLRRCIRRGTSATTTVFLLEEERMLFAGDHIMNGSTVVIIPPGGDMQAYIGSLEMLLDYPLQRIAPGHGEVIEDSEAEIERPRGAPPGP